MTGIEELTNALKNGRAIYEEIMGRDTCPDFRVRELYSARGESGSRAMAEDDAEGTIACGDNLEYMEYLLKKCGMAGKLQLVYVDPPFFSKGRYQASVTITSEEKGKSPVIKTGAYDDTWEGSVEKYLTMMTVSLLMMRELLSDTGLIWVHLDWHCAHYVKIIMDEIFGYDNFVNEIIWTYKSGGASGRCFAKKHDTLLLYSRSRKYKFNKMREKSYNRGMKPYRFKGVEEYQDEKGWYTMVNMKDVWNIDMVGRTSSERPGYATQKPEKLLERILASCTDEGDFCADFFAGSGTLGAVARKMGRRWIMCDSGDLAAAGQIKRICSMGKENRPFRVVGKNADTSSGEAAFALEDGMLKITGYKPELSGLSPSDMEKTADFLRGDGRPCISFWSLDREYDGLVHRSSEFLEGRYSVEIGEGSVHVTGYDVFGNRFCWERIKG